MKDILGYLRCFEAASRTLNFTEAANELNITQSAVSHQLKELSLRCGFALFRRNGNSQELTEKGAELAHLVSGVLASLDRGIDDLTDPKLKNTLLVHCDPVLANRWLLPRLDRMEAQSYALNIELRSSGEARDADVVIGFESLSGFEALAFEEDVCIPLCSPDVLRVGQTTLTPEDLQSETRIALGSSEHEALYGLPWSEWEVFAGSDLMPNGGTETHGSVELALQAAVHGRGVVLLRRSIADDDLRAGRLVPLSQDHLAAPQPILLSVKLDGKHLDISRMLVSWLHSELRGNALGKPL